MRSRLLFILLLMFVFSPAVFSEDWDNFTDLDKAWETSKPVPNQDYEKVINALEEKKTLKEKKKRKKIFKKVSGGGTSLHKELNPDVEIQEIDNFVKKEELLLNVPVDFILNDKVLERGYYKILSERDENKNIIIKFYQSQYFKGSIIATETQDDYEQEKIDFVEIQPFNESFLKLIFGSLDYNAYAYVQFLEN